MAHSQSRYSLYQDEQLMQSVCAGEVSAFDELYSRYGKRLSLYFLRMLNFNRSLAEDAVQDLFLKIAEKPHLFEPSRSFKTWIFSVASNICKNYYRHNLVKRNHAPFLALDINAPVDGFILAANRLDHAEFLRTLNETLSELPAEKKEVFILRFQEEKTIAEIADIQGVPEGSVKSRLHYTLKFLGDRLSVFNPLN